VAGEQKKGNHVAQDYRDLLVWQKAIELALCVYDVTSTFPKEEMFGLRSQMRRAAVSIASNIAEGRGRLNPAEFRHFLGLAQGSTYELQTQLLIASHLGMSRRDAIGQAQSLTNEVSKMLAAFIAKLSTERKTQKQRARG
jgi:four helix bundle protein